MEINIKMKDCRFFVDEEKRTVICVIENTSNLVFEFFNINKITWDDDANRLVNIYPNYRLEKKLVLPDRFVGKAVCAPEDEWNEEAGRLIAFDRAKMKLNTSFFKRAQEFVTEVDITFGNMVSRVNEYGERLGRGADRRLEHIMRICPTFEEEEKNNEER